MIATISIILFGEKSIATIVGIKCSTFTGNFLIEISVSIVLDLGFVI